MKRQGKSPDEPDNAPAQSVDEPDSNLEPIDDSARFRRVSREKMFVRGLIEVQFERDSPSGVEEWDFEHEKERQEFSNAWPPKLKEILGSHSLLGWRPSFPLRYPWSPHESNEAALAAYFKAGRDKFVTFRFPLEGDVLSIAKALRERPEIRKAVAIPDIAPPASPLTECYTGTSDQVVNPCNGCLTNQWYLFRCNVPDVWSQQLSGQGVVIADIDWGFNVNHEDLTSRAELTQNMFPDLQDHDLVGHGQMGHHGTAVLGLAGAAVNGKGMAGIAYNAGLWAIQAGTESRRDHDLWVAGINFVRTIQTTSPKVIILEIQTVGLSNIESIPSIFLEISAAIGEGIVVCVPAGNGNDSGDAGKGDDGQPIDDTGSIVVGATRYDSLINPVSDSNSGKRVNVYAPGDTAHDLTCGVLGTQYSEGFGGTSGATAKVAGVVALMLEKNPQLKPLQIREILKNSQKEVVDNQMNPIGVLLDAYQAVAEA